LLFFLTPLISRAQSVLSGPTSVCPDYLTSNAFSISFTTQNATISKVRWTASFLGNRGKINGTQNLPTEIAGNAGLSVGISWDYQFAGSQDIVIALIYFKLSTDAPQDPLRTEEVRRTVKIRELVGGIMLVQPSINKCCLNPLTYTFDHLGEANVFNWTLPNGWTITSQTYDAKKKQSKIIVVPDNQSGGIIKCVSRMSCVTDPNYNIERSISVSRPDAIITLNGYNAQLSATNPTYINVKQGICPDTDYTYRVNPVCGAIGYSFTFPLNWGMTRGEPATINTSSPEATIRTRNNPQSGDIVINVHFNGCQSLTYIYEVRILTQLPSAPIFHDGPGDYSSFHCGKWNICPDGDNSVSVAHLSNLHDGVSHYVWSVTAPWYFVVNGVNQQTATVARNKNLATGAGMSPVIKRQSGSNASTGTVSVYAINCLGSGPSSSATIHVENPLFCPGLSNSQNYPIWCACCQPNGNDPNDPWNPLKTEAIDSNIELFPNPTSGVCMLTLPEDYHGSEIFIFGVRGELVQQQKGNFGENNINVTHLPNGTYIVQVRGSLKTINQRLIIQK